MRVKKLRQTIGKAQWFVQKLSEQGESMSKDEALRLALEALESTGENNGYHGVTQYFEETMVDQAITAIKAALEAKDEPVAWWIPKHKAPDMVSKVRWSDECEPLYTTPPQRKPLTDEEIAEAVGDPLDSVYLADFRKVEAKLKEKNT